MRVRGMKKGSRGGDEEMASLKGEQVEHGQQVLQTGHDEKQDTMSHFGTAKNDS